MCVSLFGEMLAVLRRYWRRYMGALAAVILANLFLIAGPLIFRHAVTRLDVEAELDPSLVSQWLSKLQSPLFNSIWTWALLLLAVASVGAIFRYLMRLLVITISRDAERDMREELFKRVQSHAQPFYDRHRVGDLMSRLTNDVSVYRDVLGPGIMYPTFFVTLVFPVLAALFTISTPMALLATLPILVLPPLMLLARKLIFQTSVDVQTALGDMSTLAQEDFSGIRLIKAYVREGTFSLRFRLLCQRFLRLSMRLLAVTGLFYPFLSVIGRLVTVALIVFSAFISGLTGADLVSFMWLQGYILMPVLMLGWILPLYQQGRGAYSRLLSLHTEPLDLLDEGSARKLSLPPSITLKHLTFSYNGGANALDNVNAQIPGGQLVGITGPPGSGKSTLLFLLACDYPLLRGMISIGERDICDLPLDDVRKLSATVEQEPFLFSRTLGENISLTRSNASRQEIEQAVARAGLTETLASLPKGLDTPVGERGVTLSGGQKQRVALARALLADAPLLLLDDPFSALDNITIEAIMGELEKMRSEKTIFLVSHSVPVLQRCDHLLCFTRGHLYEQGTPDALAASDGHYGALVELDRMIRERA